MSWPLKLPPSLRDAAYYAGQEPAWPAEEAIDVVRHATKLDLVVCGIEVWLPTVPGSTIPTPYVYTWQCEEQELGESWRDYVQRINAAAERYIREFHWDPRDTTHQELKPCFNVDVQHR